MGSEQKIVMLLPGQILKLQVGEVGGRPCYVELSHEEVLDNKTHVRPAKTRNRDSKFNTKASRQVSLFCRAIHTGKWTTGATVDCNVIMRELIDCLNRLPTESVKNLSPHAENMLINLRNEIHSYTTVVEAASRTCFANIVDRMVL